MHGLRLCALMMLAVTQFVSAAGTCTWTGGGADANWSTVQNWNCVATPPEAHPANGDGLVFPDGALQLDNHNDLTSLSVVQVQFTNLNHVIAGNALGVGAISGNLPAGSGSDQMPRMEMAITMTGATPTVQCTGNHGVALDGEVDLNGLTLTVDGDCDVDFQKLTGASGIVKNGTNRLLLTAPSSDYTGPTTVNNGLLVTFYGASLGATGAGNGTTIASGGTLAIGPYTTLDEH